MSLKPEVTEQILSAIRAKVPTWRPCAVCGSVDWQLTDGFVRMPVVDDFLGTAGLGPRALPLIGIYCKACGNTVLLNLLILGLADLIIEHGAITGGQRDA